jgi:hypothetical protein
MTSVCSRDLEDAVLTLTLTFKGPDSRVGRVITRQGQEISRQAMFSEVSINSPRLHGAQRLRNSSCHTIFCCALPGCQSTTEPGAKSNHWALCFSSEAQRSVVHGRQSLPHSVVVLTSPETFYFRPQIRAGCLHLQLAATCKTCQEVSARSTHPHFSAFKAIVHHLANEESCKEGCQWSSPPSWRSLWRLERCWGFPNSSSPMRSPPPHDTGAFPSGSSFREMNSVMPCS